ncbi:MAG: ATP-binding protein [Pseudomonadota bacterium]
MDRILEVVWFGRSIRTQLLIAIGVINVFALVIVSVIFIANARQATRVEMEATVELAKNFVQLAVHTLSPDARPEELASKIDRLSSRLRIGSLRHVRILMANANGELVQLSPEPNAKRGQNLPPPAPKWFEALIAPQAINVLLSTKTADRAFMIEIPVVGDHHRWDPGNVVVSGEPADEIAEVWADLASLGPVVGLIDILVIATLYAVLGRLLEPMGALAKGLTRLEEGDYSTRVIPPRTHEILRISLCFNRLAETLGRTRMENERLYGQLVTVQEDERRAIANELHDEASPCLFGIMANALSAQRSATDNASESRVEICERLGEILTITDRLKQLNRVMLKKLRPVSVGHVALSELARDLIDELKARYPDVDLTHSIRTREECYGETIDLTVYRCIQEGVTNAIRHGDARAIRVDLFCKRQSAGLRRLELLIQDDGSGISSDTSLGFGLTAMRERVRALSGTWAIQSLSTKGTLLRIDIPLSVAQPQEQATQSMALHDTDSFESAEVS